MEPKQILPFDAWLRGRRAELNQKQSEAAELVGTNRATWSAWESGAEEPRTLARVHSIAIWSGFSPAAIFGMMRNQ